MCHSVSHYFIHTKVKRGADTAWCHSKLGPASTFSGAWEGEDERGFLSRDDDAAGGVSKRRRLETGQALKAAKVWPCLAGLSRGRRENALPARSAPQARDHLAKQWRGFQPHLDQDPWKSQTVLCSKNRSSERAAISPLPPRSLQEGRKCSGWGRIQPVLEPLRLSRATE